MIVQGMVRDEQDRARTGIRLRFFYVGLRNEHELASNCTTNEHGAFRAELDSTLGLPPALRVRAYVSPPRQRATHNEPIEIADSGEICRPGPELYVELIATPRSGVELDDLLEKIEPYLDGVNIRELTPADGERLACMANESEERIMTLIAAERLRAEIQLDLPSAYALVRSGLPSDARRLLATPPREWNRALRQAVESRWVGPSVLKLLPRTIELLQKLARQRFDDTAPGPHGASLGATLRATGMNAALASKFIDLYLAHDGDEEALWKRTRESLGDAGAQAVERGLTFAALTLNQPRLVDALGGVNADLPHPSAFAARTEAEWRALLDHAQIDGPEALGADSASRRETYARVLHTSFSRTFPTQALAARLGGSSTHRAVATILGREGFELRDADVAKIDLASAPAGEVEAIRNELGRAKRLLRVSDDAALVGSLMQRSDRIVRSASQIAAMSFGDFSNGFPEDVTYYAREKAYSKAKAIKGQSFWLSSMLDKALVKDWPWLPDFDATVPPSTLDAFPDLAKLLGSQTRCACDECRAVDGPAAYLVDLLKFVSKKDAALAELLSTTRRPEIATLRLSCANTNTAMPRIDLVLEALEHVVTGATPPVSIETTKTTAELSAVPEFPNPAAYDDLATTTFPWTSPFELHTEDADIHLAELGVSRAEVFEATSKDAIAHARAVLHMPAAEWTLLSTDWPSISWTGTPTALEAAEMAAWGDKNPSSVVNVGEFLRRSGTTTAELDRLLLSTFVNPAADVNARVGIATDATCDPELSTLTHLDLNPQFHARYLRFVRLQRRLGWSVNELDRALEHKTAFDSDLLTFVAGIARLAERLGVSVDHALTIVCGPDDRVRRDAASQLVRPTAFDPKTASKDLVVAALALAPEELAAAGGDSDLGLLAKRTLLARGLRMTNRELARIVALPGVTDPFASATTDVTTVGDFVTFASRVGASSFSIDELSWIVAGEGTDNRVTKGDAIARMLTEIAKGIIAIDIESQRALEAGADVFDVVNRRLTSELALSNVDVDAARAMLERTGPAVAVATVSALLPFLDTATATALANETTPDVPTADTLTEIVRKRFVAIRPWLVEASAMRAKNALVLSLVASTFQLAPTSAASLLSIGPPGAKALDLLRESPTSAASTAPLVGRCAIVISRLALTADDVKLLVEKSSALGSSLAAIASTLASTRVLDLEDLLRVQRAAPAGSIRLLPLIGASTSAKAIGAATGWTTDEASLAALTSTEDWLRAAREVAFAKRVGQSVATVRTWAVASPSESVATSIRNALRARFEGVDAWLVAANAPRDRLRVKQRRALVDYVAWKKYAGNVTTLSQKMLFDVEAGVCEKTSRVKHAIGAVQAFVQQALLNLEENAKFDEEATRQWRWMRFYRVWQANRRVFLFPENWVDPSLRDDKTPFFVDLQAGLGSGDVTQERAERVLREYLEKLDKVSRLEVVSMFRDEGSLAEPDAAIDGVDPASDLWVLARTATAPYEWFTRRRERGWRWTPWEKVELDIPADDATVVIWNRRPWIFWFETLRAKSSQPDAPQTMPKGGEPYTPPKEKEPDTEIRLGWSEYRNGRWLGKRRSKTPLVIAGMAPPPNPAFPTLGIRAELEEESGGLVVRCLYDYRAVGPKIAELAAKSVAVARSGTFRFDGCGQEPTVTPFDLMNAVLCALPPASVLDGFGARRPNASELAVRGEALIPADRDILTLDVSLADLPPEVKLLDLQKANAAPADFRLRFASNDGQFFFTPFVQSDRRRVFFVDAAPAPRRLDPAYRGPHRVPRGIEKILTESFASSVKPKFPHVEASSAANSSPARPMLELRQDVVKKLPREVRGEISNAVKGAVGAIAKNEPNDHYRYFTFHHPHGCELVRRLERDGVDGLLHPRDNRGNPDSAQDLLGPSTFAELYGPTENVVTPYPKDDIELCVGSPYGIYNWELFFHIPHLIATRLIENRQFEDALQWLGYVFDPTNPETATEKAPACFWNFRPFRVEEVQANIVDVLEHLAQGKELSQSKNCHTQTLAERVVEWRRNPFRPHLVARDRPGAYATAIVFTYLDALIGWADQLFRQDTLETITQATQLYLLAQRLLGRRPDPIRVPKRGKDDNDAGDPTKPQDPPTWKWLKDKLDEFSEAIEPYVEPASGAYDSPYPFELPPTLAFCVPQNEKVVAYYDVIDDRLYKIRHCMNLKGVVRDLALFEPPIDPALLVRLAASGTDVNAAVAEAMAPPPRYRFGVMLQKAHELAGEVRSLGGALLSALEKRDAETIARMRATHEKQLLGLVRTIKERALEEATLGLEGLRASLEGATTRKAFYERKAGELMNASEGISLSLQAAAQAITLTKTVHHAIASAASSVPALKVGVSGVGGSPVSTVAIDISQLIGQSSRDGASIIDAITGALTFSASVASTIGGYQQRQDDRRLQSEVVASEIDQLRAQIAAATIRQAIAQKDLENHERQIENAEAVEAFMFEKFTNVELYDWMVGQISAVYFQTYGLAFEMSKRAEAAFQHELGITGSPGFVNAGHWQDRRQGLLAGERLAADLRALEAAYLEQNQRELQITKNVSLAIIAPHALQTLKREGECTFSLDSWIYELDFPSHYMRRIQSVAITIACVSGPYQGVPATLTLLSDRTVRRPGEAAVTNASAVQSIVTSHAQNDTGMFEQREDPMYFPFERAGADSTWRLRIGVKDLETFDWASISDVIMHVRYTARDGGELVATPVVAALKDRARKGERMFSARGDFGDAFYKMLNGVETAPTVLKVRAKNTHFPFITRSTALKVTKVEAYFVWEAGVEAGQPTVKVATPFDLGDEDQEVTIEVKDLPSEVTRTISAGGTDYVRIDPKKIRDLVVVMTFEPK